MDERIYIDPVSQRKFVRLMSCLGNTPRNAPSLETPSVAPRMTRSSIPQMAKLVSRMVASVPVARGDHSSIHHCIR